MVRWQCICKICDWSVMHPKVSSYSSERIHYKAPILSHQARAHTYIKYNRGRFWYPYSIGSMGVSTFSIPNKFICKVWIMYSIITKFCKVALTSTMCTCVHMSIHDVMWVNMRSMCIPCIMCINMWCMFLANHGF